MFETLTFTGGVHKNEEVRELIEDLPKHGIVFLQRQLR